MTSLNANEIITNSAVRTWYQVGTGGTRYFFGDGYHFISGATMPVGGTIDPIYTPDPRAPGRYRLVARTRAAPDLPEFSVDFHERWGGIPRHLLNNQCQWTFYEVRSRCGDPSDFSRGWDGAMIVYARALMEGGIDLGTRTARDADDPLQDSVTFKAAAIYPVGSLSFGSEADTEIERDVVDVVFGQTQSCGECSADNDGSNHIYALTSVTTPSAALRVVYSLDQGITWQLAPSVSGSDTPRFIDIAGNQLFFGTDSTTMRVTTLTTAGAPSSWGAVTLAVAMQDVYVQSASSIWFATTNGRIYRTTDILTAPILYATVGSAQYNRIHGVGSTLVAVGNGGAVAISVNGGLSWAAGTAAGSAHLQAVAVVSETTWWVGNASGELYRTRDRGVTYENMTGQLSGAPNSIFDIVFATPEVGWISAQTGTTTARLYATFDGGASWPRDDSTVRVVNWPTFQRARRLATPTTSPAVAANYLAAAGNATAPGTDGVLLLGLPTMV